jgi:hypothetical protein
MSKRFEVLSPQQALGMVWRRSYKVASSLRLTGQTDLGDPSISLVPDKVDIKEGDWVTVDANGDLVKVTTPTRFAFPVYTDGARFDVRAGARVTVLYGIYSARTAAIISPAPVVAAAGVPLVAALGVLRVALAGEPVNAVSERPILPGDSQFPDGFVEFTTLVGSVVP